MATFVLRVSSKRESSGGAGATALESIVLKNRAGDNILALGALRFRRIVVCKCLENSFDFVFSRHPRCPTPKIRIGVKNVLENFLQGTAAFLVRGTDVHEVVNTCVKCIRGASK